MRCFPSKPSATDSITACSVERTRAKQRSLYSVSFVYFISSLLPVVIRIFPSVFCRYSTASSTDCAQITLSASSGTASIFSRRQRRYCTPEISQALLISPVTSCANGWVASITRSICFSFIISAICFWSIRPKKTSAFSCSPVHSFPYSVAALT